MVIEAYLAIFVSPRFCVLPMSHLRMTTATVLYDTLSINASLDNNMLDAAVVVSSVSCSFFVATAAADAATVARVLAARGWLLELEISSVVDVVTAASLYIRGRAGDDQVAADRTDTR